MTYATPPAISGTVIPKPNSLDERDEPVRTSVELANGSLRSYTRGTRKVYELAWNRASEATVTLLRSLLAPAFVPYLHQDGTTRIVETSAVTAAAIPATDPVRFAVSTTLTEQTPR